MIEASSLKGIVDIHFNHMIDRGDAHISTLPDILFSEILERRTPEKEGGPLVDILLKPTDDLELRVNGVPFEGPLLIPRTYNVYHTNFEILA